MSTKVSIVIVTYNSAAHIGALLDSLPAATGDLDTQVIVVDNGSTDATLERVMQRAGVTVVAAGGNVGYAAAINIARAMVADDRALMVLNPDQVLAPDAVTHLIAALSAKSSAPQGVGVVSPVLTDPTGRVAPHLRREPTILNEFGEALFGDRWPGRPGWFSQLRRDPADYTSAHEVDWAGGAVVLVSPNCAAAVGDWREDFFLYAEETDFMARARDAGFSVRFEPLSVVEHVGAGSGGSPALVALMAVNQVRYYRSRHRLIPTTLFASAQVLNHALRSSRPEHRPAVAALLVARRRRQLPRGDRPSPRVLDSPVVPAGESAQVVST